MRKDHIRIVKGLLTVAFFVFIGKFAGAIKEVVIAAKYGIGATVDAYFLVFTLVIWVPSVWNAIMTSAYVPLSRQTGGEERLLFNRELLGVALLSSGFLAAVFLAFVPKLLTTLQSDTFEQVVPIAHQIIPIMTPMIVGGFLASYFSARLLAQERHSNTLTEGIPPLCIAILLLLWPYGLTALPIAGANLLGVILQVLVLFWLLARHSKPIGISFGFRSDLWRQFRHAIGWLLLGQIIISFNQPIDMYLAGSTGVGGVSELGYAKKILALLLGLGATAVGRAILPVLSDQERGRAQTQKIAYQWAWLMIVLGGVAAVVGAFLSPWVVQLLFERGEFTAANTEAVAKVLSWGLFQLPFFYAGIVLVQLAVSLGLYRYIFYTGVLGILVKLSAGYLLVEILGIPGLMLSTALMYAANWLLLLFLIKGSSTQQATG